MLVFWHHAQMDLYASSALTGLGIGFAFASMPTFINGAVSIQQAGIANGMNAVMRTVGDVIGTAVVATILASNTKTVVPGVSPPTEAAYDHGFPVTAMLGVLAALVPVALRSAHGHDRPAHAE